MPAVTRAPDQPPSETGSLDSLLRKSKRGAAFVYRPRPDSSPMHLVRFALGRWRQVLDRPKIAEVGLERFFRGEEGHMLLRISHGAAPSRVQLSHGLGIHVPPRIEGAARGRPIRVQAVARSDDTYLSEARLGLAYFTYGPGGSGWRWFAVPRQWSIVEFTWVVPEKEGLKSTISLLPGPPGTRGIDICQVTLSIGDPT